MSNKQEVVRRLMDIGISYDDAVVLRRISMTLHRWHELECGSDAGCIERDEKTGKPHFVYSLVGRRSGPIADKEKGALKRLDAVMKNYPGFAYYIQGDPRGASLYIMSPGEMASREPGWLEANYNRGVAVYK